MDHHPYLYILTSVHRVIGYITVFIVGPVTLWTYYKPITHRKWAKAYLYLMTFLYLTGIPVTLIVGELGTWSFLRSLYFNLFGFSFLWFGYRAIYRMVNSPRSSAGMLDWSMTVWMVLLSIGMLGLFWEKMQKYELCVFGCLGLILAVVEIREYLTCSSASLLLARHNRYILASYAYMLTVISVVHLQGTGKIKWLWPTITVMPVIFLTSLTAQRLLKERHPKWMGIGLKILFGATYVLGIVILTAFRDIELSFEK